MKIKNNFKTEPNVEILAPAGDENSFYAAVNNGADAVYLGLNAFNARAKAGNFTPDNINQIVNFAHVRGVKVYLTLNTLIKNSEMNKVLSLAEAAYNAKTDAFIVQDVGLAYKLKQRFPNIVLHASTQMGVHNLDGARILQQLGFSRVVLSRETTLADIQEIKKNTSLEIEFFVHGALCTAFSGNCYFSSLMHNESGNRGRCLQPCRLPYVTEVNGKQSEAKFVLSSRDLCLINNIKVLTDAGVTCFKIEGRMKRAGYVATVVAQYREALNEIYEEKTPQNAGRINTLKEVFSRGEFNETAYLYNNKNTINLNTNNHTGVCIGKVVFAEKFKTLYEITLKVNRELHLGDGLKFYEQGKETGSLGVGNVVDAGHGLVKVYGKACSAAGSAVHLLLDAKKEQFYLQKIKRVPITAVFTAAAGKCAELTLTCNEVNVAVKSAENIEEAKTAPTSNENIIQQVSKLADTPFIVNAVEVNAKNVFIAKSVLNAMRREAAEKLQEEIIKNYKLSEAEQCNITLANSQSLPFNIEQVYVVNELEQVKWLQSENKDVLLIYAPAEYNALTINGFFESVKKEMPNACLGLNLPAVARGEDVTLLDEIVANLNKSTVLLANNLYALKYAGQYPIMAGYFCNALNSTSAQVLQALGANWVVNSIECEKENLINKFSFNTGRPVLMTFCHCPTQVVCNNSCSSCKLPEKLLYVHNSGYAFPLRRVKMVNCYYELLADKVMVSDQGGGYSDLRNISQEEYGEVLNFFTSSKLPSNKIYTGLYKRVLK